LDIQQIAAAEAAVVAEEIPVNQGGKEPAYRQWLVLTLGGLLLVSVIFNIILLARG
jgi:hypothetical protein